MTNMATDSEVTRWIRWLLTFLLVMVLGFRQVKSYAPDIEVTCKSTVDLLALGYDAGVLVSRLPSRIPIYANEEERCDIYVSVPPGYELMLYFDWLDLYGGDLTRCETTSLQLFDGAPGQYLQGLQRKICGQEEEMPKDMFFVLKNYLILRVEANSNILGSGFRIHFTRYRLTIPCSRDEFLCETYGNKRCIANHLVCDDWNDCGDWVDEEQYCDRLTPGAIAGIVLAAVFFVGLFVFLFVWFCKRRDQVAGEEAEKDADFMMRLRDPDTSEPWKSSNIGTMAPFGVSSESVERQEYAPRYANKRNSGSRSKVSRSQDLSVPEHEDAPPPYVETGSRYTDDSRSDDASEVFDDDRPRSRWKGNGRPPPTAPNPNDDVFEESQEPPRVRRGRSRSQEDRLNSRPVETEARQTREDPRYAARPEERDSRYPPGRDGRESPREDRYPPREERPPSRNSRHTPRRDERDEDYEDRYPPRDDRRPSARDERDRRDRRDDRDPRDRRSERDPRDRRDDRDPRDRRTDRDPRDRRDDRDPRDRRSERDPRDRWDDRDPRDRRSAGSGPRHFSDDDDDELNRSGVRDSLHPLRRDRGLSERRSLQDLGTDDEKRSNRGGGRSGDERSIPASEEFPPPPNHWDEPTPPQSRRKPDVTAAPPSGRKPAAAAAAVPAARDDNDSERDEAPRSRQGQRPGSIPPASKPPPSTRPPTSPDDSSELPPDDPPPRSRRRRRSRSREGREGGRAGGRAEEAPAVVMLDYDDDDEPRPFKSRGLSYREEAV